ncbi:hypothetical protein [uncultured Hydrogenophaga sp.]|uniref:hypothetical protein n=1 Tax=uncultured Hydrogenophaga sp. TaxID=199683 RepID=UPI00265EBCD2|nr:hypothetical protein [uncultured Hydrogenophaga sp.]
MLEFIVITSALFTLNPWMGAHFPVIGIGQRLALLRPVLPAEFAYPDWQAALSISLISIMAGLGARNEWIRPHNLSASSWSVFLWGFMVTGGCFLLVVSILQWWVLRTSRSLGNPSFFKVFAAAWLLPAVLSSGLLAVGLPAPWATVIFFALGITSFHALRCATPWLRSPSLVAGLILACASAWLLVLVSRVEILSLLNGL